MKTTFLQYLSRANDMVHSTFEDVRIFLNDFMSVVKGLAGALRAMGKCTSRHPFSHGGLG